MKSCPSPAAPDVPTKKLNSAALHKSFNSTWERYYIPECSIYRAEEKQLVDTWVVWSLMRPVLLQRRHAGRVYAEKRT